MILEVLNNDCLLHIFQFLSINDRVRTEVVCKRWRILSQISWREITRLDASTWGLSVFKINAVMLQNVLLKCGRFLKHLKVPNVHPHNFNTEVLNIIPQYCPNLTSIDFSELMIYADDLKSVLKRCKNITKLTVTELSFIFNDELSFLQECSKLNYFEVNTNIYFTGMYLWYLPAQTIRTLIIRRCFEIDDFMFAAGLRKLKNLEHLKICLSFIGQETMKVISNCCTNLKELEIQEFIHSLNNFIPDPKPDTLQFINLVNLQVLKIRNFPLLEEHCTSIAKNCLQITTLDISGGYYVNNAALMAVTTLPKLEYLYIDYFLGMTRYGFKNMKNLKGFVCRCTDITDKVIYQILVSSPQLRLLDLSHCSRITSITYELAKVICNSRPSKMVLNLHINGTQIVLTDRYTVTPLLHIVN